ncbi:hypothetical protein K431DRAFT_282391 [Polychaeton citri CBS 116435]|uniref:Uncharacterized protein n=1 Tax=Polychaeton citri CBS 116435 TaxID=1314669 RepID=A0A9P4USV7_9PEZI|nr:hypothetical protein K431DRAFT_282391 [Polychaeton citri CBS 116435]
MYESPLFSVAAGAAGTAATAGAAARVHCTTTLSGRGNGGSRVCHGVTSRPYRSRNRTVYGLQDRARVYVL